MKLRWKFAYGDWEKVETGTCRMTVTVNAYQYEDALGRARDALDRRYERADKEPPVGWTLVLFDARLVTKEKA